MWGLNWGEMVWGRAGDVPLPGPVGLVLLALYIALVGAIFLWRRRPRGAGVAVLALLLALPANFVPCDGQVVSDAESPLDGETLPDLNGEHRFLRGADTSGATGGAALVAVGNGEAHENRPSYYEVVWVIRVT